MGTSKNGFDKKQLLWGIIAGVITVGFMAVSYKVGLDKGKGEVKGEETVIAEEITEREVYIEMKDNCSDFEEVDVLEDGKSVKKYCAVYVEGDNAFKVMKKVENNSDNFTFGYDESDYGIFVTSINNYHPDTESQFWSLYINEEMSMVGVADYMINSGDEIMFKLEEVTF